MVIWIMFFLPDHNLIKKNQVYDSNNIGNKELYEIQVLLKYTKPTSQHYFFETFFAIKHWLEKKLYREGV